MGKALRVIEERDLLKEGGLVVCEYEYDDFETNLDLFKEKSYGFKKLKFLSGNFLFLKGNSPSIHYIYL